MIDYSNVKGKCSDCDTDKPLDEMVRKEGIKGLYHCIDCETEQTAKEMLGSYITGKTPEFKTDNDKKKLKKVLRWCFG